MNTLRGKLVVLVSVALLALCLLAGVARLGNEMSERTVERGMVAKDVVADILPPPMYLIELRLVLGMAVAGEMPMAEAQKEYARVSKEYADRVAHWTQHPPSRWHTCSTSSTAPGWMPR